MVCITTWLKTFIQDWKWAYRLQAHTTPVLLLILPLRIKQRHRLKLFLLKKALQVWELPTVAFELVGDSMKQKAFLKGDSSPYFYDPRFLFLAPHCLSLSYEMDGIIPIIYVFGLLRGHQLCK